MKVGRLTSDVGHRVPYRESVGVEVCVSSFSFSPGPRRRGATLGPTVRGTPVSGELPSRLPRKVESQTLRFVCSFRSSRERKIDLKVKPLCVFGHPKAGPPPPGPVSGKVPGTGRNRNRTTQGTGNKQKKTSQEEEVVKTER